MSGKNAFFICRNPQLNPFITYGALTLHWLYIALVLHQFNICSTLVSNWYWLQCCMNCVSASSAIQPSIYPEATLLHNNLYSYLWNLLAQRQHYSTINFILILGILLQHYFLSNISYSSLKSRKCFLLFDIFSLALSRHQSSSSIDSPKIPWSAIYSWNGNEHTLFPVSFLHSGISIRVKFSNTITWKCVLLCPIPNQANGYHCGKIVGSTLGSLLY